jgi:hypothetical protein
LIHRDAAPLQSDCRLKGALALCFYAHDGLQGLSLKCCCGAPLQGFPALGFRSSSISPDFLSVFTSNVENYDVNVFAAAVRHSRALDFRRCACPPAVASACEGEGSTGVHGGHHHWPACAGARAEPGRGPSSKWLPRQRSRRVLRRRTIDLSTPRNTSSVGASCVWRGVCVISAQPPAAASPCKWGAGGRGTMTAMYQERRAQRPL